MTTRKKPQPHLTFMGRGQNTGFLNSVLGIPPKKLGVLGPFKGYPRKPEKRANVTERQMSGLLLRRLMQKDHLNSAIEGIRRRLREMNSNFADFNFDDEGAKEQS